MIKKILILVISVIVFPMNILGKEYTFGETNLKIDVNEEAWSLEKQYEKEGGKYIVFYNEDIAMTIGYIDAYEIAFNNYDVSREYFNYKNIISSNNLVDSNEFFDIFLSETDKMESYEKIEYNISFLKSTSFEKIEGESYIYNMYLTINNGYFLSIGTTRPEDSDSSIYEEEMNKVLSSFSTTKESPEYKGEQISITEENIFSLLISLVITIIIYCIYPFIKYVLLKKEYDSKKLKITLIINSTVIFLIDCIISIPRGATPGLTAAFLYYGINYSIYSKKLKRIEKSMRHEGFEDI